MISNRFRLSHLFRNSRSNAVLVVTVVLALAAANVVYEILNVMDSKSTDGA